MCLENDTEDGFVINGNCETRCKGVDTKGQSTKFGQRYDSIAISKIGT